MIPLNNHHVIKLIDNTAIDPLYSAHVPGYTNLGRLIHPNLGEVITSETLKPSAQINFYSAGIFRVPGHSLHLVADSQVFLVNGDIREKLSGVVVKPKPIKQSDAITIRTQDFFVVQKSNCDIKLGTVVICVPRTGYRFNTLHEADLFFVEEDNILLVVDPSNGIQPGPDFKMLEVVKKKNEFIDFVEEIKGIGGMYPHEAFMFLRAFLKINILGKEHWVVRKADIYGKV